MFWCSFTWQNLVLLSENPLWSWQGLLENMNMNSRIYLLSFKQFKCLQTVGTVTQWWLKRKLLRYVQMSGCSCTNDPTAGGHAEHETCWNMHVLAQPFGAVAIVHSAGSWPPWHHRVQESASVCGCKVHCFRLLHESCINCILMVPAHRMLE